MKQRIINSWKKIKKIKKGILIRDLLFRDSLYVQVFNQINFKCT